MITRQTIEGGCTTPAGLILPPGARVELEVLDIPKNKDLWRGRIPLDNKKITAADINKRLPKKGLLGYNNAIVVLIQKFIEHYHLNTKNNSSLHMLLETKGIGYPTILHVTKTPRKNIVLVQVIYNYPESVVSGLKSRGKVIKNG